MATERDPQWDRLTWLRAKRTKEPGTLTRAEALELRVRTRFDRLSPSEKQAALAEALSEATRYETYFAAGRERTECLLTWLGELPAAQSRIR